VVDVKCGNVSQLVYR